jgi:hypothetical protein
VTQKKRGELGELSPRLTKPGVATRFVDQHQNFRKSRGGKRSRNKCQRTELFVKHALQAHGISATKVSRMYQPGHDITARVAGRDLRLEVKSRAQGFGALYKFLEQRDVLVVKADRQEPLVILPLRLAIEIAQAARRPA